MHDARWTREFTVPSLLAEKLHSVNDLLVSSAAGTSAGRLGSGHRAGRPAVRPADGCTGPALQLRGLAVLQVGMMAVMAQA